MATKEIHIHTFIQENILYFSIKISFINIGLTILNLNIIIKTYQNNRIFQKELWTDIYLSFHILIILSFCNHLNEKKSKIT